MADEQHPWLKWPNCDREQKVALNNKLAELQHRSICQPRFIEAQLCEKLKVKDKLKAMLKTKDMGVDIPMWERALNIKEQIYREWCLEFYCSLQVKKKPQVAIEWDSEKLISFRLGGKEHKVSVIEFAVLAGIIKQEETRQYNFRAFIFKGMRDSSEFDAHEAWNELTGLPKHTGTSKASAIRFPILRLIHKLLTHSFIQRSTQKDKVYVDDLWLLHTFHKAIASKYVCVPWVLICFMEARGAGRQKDSQICCGHFVTRIARNLRLLLPANISKCSAPVEYRFITMQELDTSKLVNPTRNGLVDEVVDSSDEEEAGADPEVPESGGKMKRGTQKQLLNEMKNVRKMMIEVGCGVRRIEQKVDCVVADYQYHRARYQPYWEIMAAAHASASGTEWPEYAPPPPYAPEQEEEEEHDEEED